MNMRPELGAKLIVLRKLHKAFANDGVALTPGGTRFRSDARDARTDVELACTAEAEQVIDTADLRQLAAGRPENQGAFISKIIRIYLEDASRCLQDLKAAAAVGDATKVAAIAHKLKSSSANLGAHGIVSLCRQIEERACDGILDNATIANIEEVWPRVHQALHLESISAKAMG